jgi:Ankyrin repeats (3 copies)
MAPETCAETVEDTSALALSRKRGSQECSSSPTPSSATSSPRYSATERTRPASLPATSEQATPTRETVAAAARSETEKDNSCDHEPIHIIVREEANSGDSPVELPLPETANDPDDYLLLLLETMRPDIKLEVKAAHELDSFFHDITEEQMARYSMKVVQMARTGDVKALQEYHTEAMASDKPENVLDCFNRFGEGLLNMACRRGFVDVVRLLLNAPVSLSARVRDDGGRTPLHDACWNPEPQLEICSWLLERDPALFLVADKRGYTPFQYARQSDWPVWCQFLYDHSEHLKALAQEDIAKTFQR